MEKRRLGRTGLMVTPLGFGGSPIGFSLEPGADVSKVLNEFLDDGLNVIDTGECYMDSEDKIGAAVSHRRDDYVLLTKTGHAVGDFPSAWTREDDWNPQMMMEGIDRSLKRLKTDHVDLLQLHSCSLDLLKQGDVIEVLKRAQEQGKTRFIGHSGDREEAVWALESGVFDTLQTSVSIADQQAIELTLPLAVKNDIGVIVKRPIANVAWTGSDAPPSNYATEYWKRLKQLEFPFLADTSASAEIPLRFTLGLPGVSTAIVGTSKPGRWRQNSAYVANGPLPEEMVAGIRARWKEVAEPDWVGQG
ncbi:MAG: aldo/keto reductase [Armatimonadetes bacterium]|nr:aldo/keto reductase [Armatimonadota bacterium]